MKIRLENSIDPLGEDSTKDKTKTSRWEPTQQEILLSVDRAVDCQRSDFRPLGKAVDRAVDHVPKQRVKTLCRSTGRSIGPNREHCSCRQSTGRSTEVHVSTLVHVGQPQVNRQSNLALPTVYQLRAKNRTLISLQNQSFSK